MRDAAPHSGLPHPPILRFCDSKQTQRTKILTPCRPVDKAVSLKNCQAQTQNSLRRTPFLVRVLRLPTLAFGLALASSGAVNAAPTINNAGDVIDVPADTTLNLPDGLVNNGTVNVQPSTTWSSQTTLRVGGDGLTGGGTPGATSSGVINLNNYNSILELGTTTTTAPFPDYTGRITGDGYIYKTGAGQQILSGLVNLEEVSMYEGTLVVSGLGPGTLGGDRGYGHISFHGPDAQFIFRLPSANSTQYGVAVGSTSASRGSVLSSERGTVILDQGGGEAMEFLANGGVLRLRGNVTFGPDTLRAKNNGTIHVDAQGNMEVSTVHAESGGTVQISGSIGFSSYGVANVLIANGGTLMGGVGRTGVLIVAGNTVVQGGGVIYANGGTTPSAIQQGGRFRIQADTPSSTVTLAAGAKYVVNVWNEGNWSPTDSSIPGVGVLPNDLLVITGGILVLDPRALIEVNLVGGYRPILSDEALALGLSLKDYPIIQLESGAILSGDFPKKALTQDGLIAYDVKRTADGSILYLTNPTSTSIVPEPSTYALWGGLGLLGLGVFRKLRQRRRRM